MSQGMWWKSTGVLLTNTSGADGTPVEFILSYQGDPLTFSMERTTVAEGDCPVTRNAWVS
jgi:hypothetical protein